MRIRSTHRLALLGILSIALYTWMVLLYPLAGYANAARPYDIEQLSQGRQWAAILYVLLLAALFALFGVALKTQQDTPHALPIVLATAAIAGLVLVWLYPLTATDLFHYVMRARQQVVYGVNPLTVAPEHFPLDPLLRFLGEWKNLPSPYGPLWELAAGAVLRIGLTDRLAALIALKLIAWASVMSTALLIGWATRGSVLAVILFAWNPLVLLQGPGNGHNDMLMLALMAAAVAWWERRRGWALAVALLTLAALVKLPALLLIPLLVLVILREQPGWQRRVLILAGAAALMLGVVLLAYAPFWPLWESLAGIRAQVDRGQTYAIVSMVRLWLRDGLPGGGLAGETAAMIPATVGRIIFLAVYALILWRLWQRRWSLAEAGFWAFFAYLFTAPGFHIWYTTWVAPLAALAVPLLAELPRRRMLWRTHLFSLTSEYSILMFYLLWRWVLNGDWLPKADWLLMHLLTVPWQYGLPLLAPLLLRPAHDRDKAVNA